MDDYDRRHFIRTSLPGFLGLSYALPAITAIATRANANEGRVPEDGAINWDAFLAEVEKEAAKQHLDFWNEAGYVKAVAALAQRLNLKDQALAEAFEKTISGRGNGRVDFYKLEQQNDFEISLLQFEEGEPIRHHDHPDMTGVILCASGEIDVWNYDLIGERPDQSVLLEETGGDRLTKGDVSTLTSKASNIHQLKSRQLTQLVDVFAPPYKREPRPKTTWFDVDPEPYRGVKKIYQATRR